MEYNFALIISMAIMGLFIITVLAFALYSTITSEIKTHSQQLFDSLKNEMNKVSHAPDESTNKTTIKLTNKL